MTFSWVLCVTVILLIYYCASVMAVSCGYNNGIYVCTCGGGYECKQETIQCEDNDDCIVYCSGDESCHSATIVCPDTNECTVQCTNAGACYNANIQWPSAYTGKILCTSYRSSCYGVNFPIPDPDLDFSFNCNSETECAQADIYCPDEANCHITCSAKSSCRDTTIHWSSNDVESTLSCTYNGYYAACEGTSLPPTQTPAPTSVTPAPILRPISPTASPARQPIASPTSLTVTISCNGGEECRQQTITCESDSDCVVNCAGTESCHSATVICPEDNKCTVQCSGTAGCYDTNIQWPSNYKGEIVCSGSRSSCYGVNFPVPTPDEDLSIQCDAKAECAQADIYCPENANCHITCSAQAACRSTIIHWSTNAVDSTLTCSYADDETECEGTNQPLGPMYVVVDGAWDYNGANIDPECVSNTEVQISSGKSIGVRCCNGDGFDATVTTPSECWKAVTWTVAQQHCADINLQLCTQTQLEYIRPDGLPNGAGSGCGFDGYPIWTQDECYTIGYTVAYYDYRNYIIMALVLLNVLTVCGCYFKNKRQYTASYQRVKRDIDADLSTDEDAPEFHK